MATLATLKAEIAVDIIRPATTYIASAITAAIGDYEHERFWFNETRGFTFSTVAATADYALTSVSTTIADFITIDWVQILVGTQARNLVRDPDLAEMDMLIATASLSGEPTSFGYFGESFRLYPIPDQVYTMRVAGHYKLADLTGDDQSNAWTTEAYQLIRNRAAARVFTSPFRNLAMAQVAEASAQDQLNRLRSQTTSRVSSNRIRPTRF